MQYEDKYIRVDYWVDDTECVKKRYPHRLLVSETDGTVVAGMIMWSTKKKLDPYMWFESTEFLYYSKVKTPRDVDMVYYWEDVIRSMKKYE